MKRLASYGVLLAMTIAAASLGLAQARIPDGVMKELAPTGKLRVGVAFAPAATPLFVVRDTNGQAHGVTVEEIRAVDHDIAIGTWPDMTEHGAASDEWPALYRQVMNADILVIAGPIWLGDNASVTKHVIERLYGCSHLLNDVGQYAYYGRVGGCLITGNEDGIKHCAMNVL